MDVSSHLFVRCYASTSRDYASTAIRPCVRRKGKFITENAPRGTAWRWSTDWGCGNTRSTAKREKTRGGREGQRCPARKVTECSDRARCWYSSHQSVPRPHSRNFQAWYLPFRWQEVPLAPSKILFAVFRNNLFSGAPLLDIMLARFIIQQ